MTLTNAWKPKVGIVLLFLPGLVIGYFLRDSLIPLEFILEREMPWLLGFSINQIILFGISVVTGIALYRYRRGHYSIRALGWGLWGGFLAGNLLFFMLVLAVATGGLTP